MIDKQGTLIKYKVSIPQAKAGIYQVEHFTVKSHDPLRFNLLDITRTIPAGKYTRLLKGVECVMSDTPAEIRDHLEFINKAEGDVLIAGLGLGMVVQALAKKQTVKNIHIVEISPEIIEMVYPHYERKYKSKLKLFNQSIFDFKPQQKYQYGWFDIWNYIESSNIPEFVQLHMQFKPYIKTIEFWAEQNCHELDTKFKRIKYRVRA